MASLVHHSGSQRSPSPRFRPPTSHPSCRCSRAHSRCLGPAGTHAAPPPTLAGPGGLGRLVSHGRVLAPLWACRNSDRGRDHKRSAGVTVRGAVWAGMAGDGWALRPRPALLSAAGLDGTPPAPGDPGCALVSAHGAHRAQRVDVLVQRGPPGRRRRLRESGRHPLLLRAGARVPAAAGAGGAHHGLGAAIGGGRARAPEPHARLLVPQPRAAARPPLLQLPRALPLPAR